MTLAVIESDYGTLRLVDKLTYEFGKNRELEITIDGTRSACSLDIDCEACKILPQCRIISENSYSSEAITTALSIFGIDKYNSPEFFI